MKKYICVRDWIRHSKGTIIEEYEYNRLPHEIKTRGNFAEYNPEPEIVPEPVQTFEKDLAKNLEKVGIKAEFKHKVKDGKSELDATFKFDESEDKNNL